MSNSRGSFLVRTALDRPVSVTVLFFALLTLGILAYTRVPLEMMPGRFTPPWLGVRIPYPNATPREVEREILQPVEDILATMSGVEGMHSRATANGAGVWVEFHGTMDMDDAYAEFADRMDRVMSQLPSDVRRYYLWKFRFEDQPILTVGVAYPEESPDPFAPIDQQLVPRLERIRGVARIEVEGVWDPSVRIYLDQERLQQYRVDVRALLRELSRGAHDLSAGELQEAGTKKSIRIPGRGADLEALRRHPIGKGLCLEDVAEVGLVHSLRSQVTRIDGKRAATIRVYKESQANTVDVSRQVREELGQLESRPSLSGYSFTFLFDQGNLIQQSLRTLRDTALWGAAFAVGILFLFLRRVRMTLLITAAIPLCLLLTVAIVYFNGSGMNIFTMMGMTLSVGLLVDNAIVVVENIARRREGGESRRTAALHGAGEITLAIVLATSTTMIVFLAIVLMNDSSFFRVVLEEIGFTVCFALSLSLLVALVFIPAAAARIGPGRRAPGKGGLLSRSTRGYSGLLNWTLEHRFASVVFALVLFAVSWIIPFSRVKPVDRGQGHPGAVNLRLSFPQTYSLQDCEGIMQDCEEALEEKREDLGFRHICSEFRRERGRITIFLKSPEEGGVTYQPAEWSERIVAVLKPLSLAGVQIQVNWREASTQENRTTVALMGRNSEELEKLGEEVAAALKQLPEVVDVETPVETGSHEARIRINRQRAQRHHIGTDSVARTLATAVRGTRLPDLHFGERDIPMIIQLEEEDRRDLEGLGRLPLLNMLGERVALRDVVDTTLGRGAGSIHRFDRETTYEVNVYSGTDDVQELAEQIEAGLSGVVFPQRTGWRMGERWRQFHESLTSFLFALQVAVLFVFLLMGVLFESVVLPFAVLVSIPFAACGVLWILFLTNTPMEQMCFVGIILLVGLVVNNAIVLVDLINRLRADGMSRRQAILEAGRHRFRPILMTALTTIFGLLPMATGRSSFIGIPYFPLARTVIGGLLFSTLLTLLLVPLFYTLFDDLRTWARRLLRA